MRGISYPEHYRLGTKGEKPYSSFSGQFLLQAFGIHNSEFELVWAEGAEPAGPAVAEPAGQVLVVRRNMAGDTNNKQHSYANFQAV